MCMRQNTDQEPAHLTPSDSTEIYITYVTIKPFSEETEENVTFSIHSLFFFSDLGSLETALLLTTSLQATTFQLCSCCSAFFFHCTKGGQEIINEVLMENLGCIPHCKGPQENTVRFNFEKWLKLPKLACFKYLKTKRLSY